MQNDKYMQHKDTILPIRNITKKNYFNTISKSLLTNRILML